MSQRNPAYTSSAPAVAAWLRIAIVALALLPPLYVLIVIRTQTVDIPFADQWAMLPVLAHSYDGTLSFGDLWVQHNEHRLLVPRALMLVLARLSGWNTRAEMGASLALAAASFCVLVYQLRATGKAIGWRWRWLVPVLSLTTFSLNQAESWWGGWNIQIFLSVLGVTASLALLSRAVPRWLTLIAAMLCGVIASYSYGPGLLIWPVGFALLALQTRAAPRATAGRILAWSSAGIITIALFFSNYTWSAQATPLGSIVRAPRPYLVYSVTYLGAPPTRGAVEYLFGQLTGDTQAICNLGDSDLCAYVNTTAIGAGIAGVAIFALVIWALARRVPLSIWLPYVGLGLYALGTGVMTSLGRASYGNHQALAQRYATTASLFWLALIVLSALCAHTYAHRRWVAALSHSLIALFSLLIMLCSIQGLDHFRWQHSFLAPARAALYSAQDDALLQRLYADPQVVKDAIPLLREHRLTIFR
jgi:hypothetical protein